MATAIEKRFCIHVSTLTPTDHPVNMEPIILGFCVQNEKFFHSIQPLYSNINEEMFSRRSEIWKNFWTRTISNRIRNAGIASRDYRKNIIEITQRKMLNTGWKHQTNRTIKSPHDKINLNDTKGRKHIFVLHKCVNSKKLKIWNIIGCPFPTGLLNLHAFIHSKLECRCVNVC